MATKRPAHEAMEESLRTMMMLGHLGPSLRSQHSDTHVEYSDTHVEYTVHVEGFASRLRIWADLDHGQPVLRGDVQTQGTPP